MKFEIYFQDLTSECMNRIYDKLRTKLADEIQETVDLGIDRETAEAEIIDHYLNTHNFAKEIEI